MIFSRFLRQYSGLVLIIQIAYFFVNDKDFLEKNHFQFGKDFAEWITENGLEIYLTLAGFTHYTSGKKENLVWIFLSPIIFFITASILKDHYTEKKLDLGMEIHEAEKKITTIEGQNED